MLTMRLPAKLEKRLTKLAKKTGKTKTSYAREAMSWEILFDSRS